MNRRHFLTTVVAVGGLLSTQRLNAVSSSVDSPRPITPVKVSRDRIIREIVGLRPYRAGGFVVEAQRIGSARWVRCMTKSCARSTAIDANPEHYSGFPVVRQYSTMRIEPSIYLDALLRDFYIAGGRLVVHEMRDRREVMQLPADVIFNCTGLGARDLFGDEELQPVRGQLVVLQPQPEIDYCYLGPGYMFPRRDGVILSGTFDEDDWSTEPRADQTAQILASHAEVMKGVKG